MFIRSGKSLVIQINCHIELKIYFLFEKYLILEIEPKNTMFDFNKLTLNINPA